MLSPPRPSATPPMSGVPAARSPGHLVAGIAAGRIDHRDAPGLGVEKRQTREVGKQRGHECMAVGGCAGVARSGMTLRKRRGEGSTLCDWRRCDGKALLRRHGVALPRGVLLRAGEAPPAEAAQWPGHVLKAQILEGGRGKRGLVRVLEGLAALADTRARNRRRARRSIRAAAAGGGGADRARDLSRRAHRRHPPRCSSCWSRRRAARRWSEPGR